MAQVGSVSQCWGLGADGTACCPQGTQAPRGRTGQVPAHGRDDTLQPREAAGQPQRTPLQQNKQPKACGFVKSTLETVWICRNAALHPMSPSGRALSMSHGRPEAVAPEELLPGAGV